MGKAIYRMCQKLHKHHLLPWFIWSAVYDKWHRLFDHGEQWERRVKNVRA